MRAQSERGVVGVLLQESGAGVLPVEADLDRFAVVCVESSPARTHAGIHRVRMAFEDALMRCCEKAVEPRYRRIGLAPFLHDPPAADDLRVKALLESCRWRFPQRCARGGPYMGGHSDDAGFVRWVKETRPDAVVCQHAGGYWLLRDAGVAIPGDLGFCAVYMNEEDKGRVAGMAGCRGKLL